MLNPNKLLFRRSKKTHNRLFRRVLTAKNYAQACAAVYDLSRVLIRLGQSRQTIVSDLTRLDRISWGRDFLVPVHEIVMAAELWPDPKRRVRK